MAQKIYNNGTDGKILMSSAGKVIRQPYEFGNAFKNRMGLNNYIKISGLSILLRSISDLMWVNESLTNTNYYYATKKAGVQNYNTSRISGNFMHVKNNANIIATQVWSILGQSLIGIENTDTYSSCQLNGVKSATGSGYSFITDETVSDIIICATVTSQTTSLTPNNYNTTASFNRYILFDRSLSIGECAYYYNNRLGSDPQTINGILIDLKLSKAEILNTGGADFVGVRDYSGNNHHGQIMNLPAGTIEEQLAYANANLFVPFLS